MKDIKMTSSKINSATSFIINMYEYLVALSEESYKKRGICVKNTFDELTT